MTVDLFYWFDKSTKRKSTLADFCVFCDVTYAAVIKHVSTRWLSLATAVERSLKLYMRAFDPILYLKMNARHVSNDYHSSLAVLSRKFICYSIVLCFLCLRISTCCCRGKIHASIFCTASAWIYFGSSLPSL